jgi:RNA-binding protein
MPLTGKQRAELRAEAHHLDVLVHVGHQGITDTVVGSLDDVLRTRELVKVQLSKNADVKAKDVAYDLAAQVQAEVIQVIGRTVTLYRPNPEIKGKAGDLPPWRR